MAVGMILTWAVEGVASASGTGTGNSHAAAKTATTPAATRPGTASNAPAQGNAAAATRGSTQSSTGNGSAGAANGNGNTPNGNKGHIQIEGTPDCGPTPCGNDNDPHVPCTLTVQLFGYPSGTNNAVLTVTGQAPSGGGTVASDSFAFSGKSSPNGNILDTERSYPLTGSQLAADGLTLQPQQGYHLRVEVSVNGHSAKTHVVWFHPCTVPAGLPGMSAGAPIPGDTTASDTGLTGAPRLLGQAEAIRVTASAPDAATPDSPATGAAVTDTPATDSGPVASDAPDSLAFDTPPVATAAIATASPAHRARSHGSGLLAFTGAEILMMLAGAATALAIGMTFVSVSRRRRSGPVTV